MDNTQKDTHNEKYVLTKKMEKNGLQCTDKVSEWGGDPMTQLRKHPFKTILFNTVLQSQLHCNNFLLSTPD